ncbi:MAG: peptidoglycan editing factor PgeF [Acidobacteria bacterium]|nr:peptidoglycan editing factor PgeF [Acidobacteriota bacterium]MCA1637963.1 peptidoglycan editing factor PgeF [Acidobacteriota bacterium]
METITNQVQSSKFKIQSSENDENQSLTENGFYWREKSGVKVLVSRALEEKGFVNGFSTRLGGVSNFPKNSLNLAGYDEDSAENIEENRKRFLQLFDGDFRLASCWQIHSADVRIIKTFEDAKDGNHKFDALVSNVSNVLLGVKTADCVPLLLGDIKTKAFAAVHAGWRGTVDSIVKNAIEKMRENYGTNSKDLICAIGPAASGKNYEIGQDVIDAFKQNFPESKSLFQKTREGHALIDLHLANKEQLISVSVLPENIFTAPLCTMERTDLFFSYRKEKKLYGKMGRLISVIGLKEN